jgi:hypothetical protein
MESLVKSMEQAFGSAKLLQVSKGAPLVAGWSTFVKNNKVTDDILELNTEIFDALVDVNPSGIWKKTQLAGALEDLDRKVELGLSLTQGRGWADQAAMLIMQSFIYLRSKQKNCHTGARYPQWLKNLLGKLSKEGSRLNSPETVAPTTPEHSTAKRLDCEPPSMPSMHCCLPKPGVSPRLNSCTGRVSPQPRTWRKPLPPSCTHQAPQVQQGSGMTGEQTVQV